MVTRLTAFGQYCVSRIPDFDSKMNPVSFLLNTCGNFSSKPEWSIQSVAIPRLCVAPAIIPTAAAYGIFCVIRATLSAGNQLFHLNFKEASGDLSKNLKSALLYEVLAIAAIAYVALGLLFGSPIFTKFMSCVENEEDIHKRVCIQLGRVTCSDPSPRLLAQPPALNDLMMLTLEIERQQEIISQLENKLKEQETDAQVPKDAQESSEKLKRFSQQLISSPGPYTLEKEEANIWLFGLQRRDEEIAKLQIENACLKKQLVKEEEKVDSPEMDNALEKPVEGADPEVYRKLLRQVSKEKHEALTLLNIKLEAQKKEIERLQGELSDRDKSIASLNQYNIFLQNQLDNLLNLSNLSKE